MKEDIEKKGDKKNKNNLLILILIFLCIFFLGFISHWRMRDFQEALPKIEMPEFEMPEIKFPVPGEEFKMPNNELFPQEPEDKKYQEFISPDKTLKLKYPANWIKMGEEILKHIDQEIKIEGAKILFLAQRIKIEKAAFASLVVQELHFEKETTLENVIEKIKKDAKEREIEIEIVELEIENYQAQFKAIYQKENHPIFHSREKILLANNKVYLITFLVLENHLPEFEKEIEKILDSVQLIL